MCLVGDAVATHLLYLDFDGVLHVGDVRVSHKRGIYIQEPGRALFEWAPILEQLIEPHPGLSIILSTSWVFQRSYNFARAHLPPRVQARVIGATYHRREIRRDEFQLMTRGQQIAADLARRRMQGRVDDWLAIDDSDDPWTPDQL